MSLAGNLADRLEDKPYSPRDWYCDLPECDGMPHKGKSFKHARTAQRLPDDLPRAIYFRGGRGCVAAGTRIYLPLEDRHVPVEELVDGDDITVLALGDDGPELATATAPFLKGFDQLWTFTMDDGSRVTVTGQHRFLTPDGWRAAEHLPVGCLLACAHDPQESSSGAYRSASREDDQHSMQTDEGSLGRCSTCHRQCDLLLHQVSCSGQGRLRGLGGALSRSLTWWRTGDRQLLRANTQTCPECGHPSRSSCDQGEPWLQDARYRVPSFDVVPFPRSTQGLRQSREWSSAGQPTRGDDLGQRAYVGAMTVPVGPLVIDEDLDSRHLSSLCVQESLAFDVWSYEKFNPKWRRLASVVPAGHGAFYDLQVPGPNNYLAEGIWHHNSGKTKAASMAFASLIVDNFDKALEWAVVAPTAGDARTVCMESVQSGLLVALGAKMASGGTIIDPGPYVQSYSKTTATIYLRSGGIVYSDGADDGGLRIQGKNLSGVMADEVGLWKNWKTSWNESIRYAVRIAPAKLIVCGTPKRTMPARDLVKLLLADDVRLGGRTVNRQLLTKDNKENLDEDTLAAFLSSMGTALERQELEGDLIDEIDGALWRIENIDANRLILETDDPQEIFDAINPLRVVIAVDPAVTANADSDETGIIVAAKGASGKGYVLEDLSGKYRPEDWPPVVIDAAERWNADRVVAEVNNGGDYIGTVLRAAGYKGAYDTVRATRGKALRAEPVAMAYQKGRGVHVGYFPELESQQTSWVPGEGNSPDRVDANVYAFSYLGVVLTSSWGLLYTPVEELDIGQPEKPEKRSSWGNVYNAKDKQKTPEG